MPSATTLEGVSLALQPVATVSAAVSMTPTAANNIVLVAQRTGGVLAVDIGPSGAAPLPVLDLSNETTNDGESGLLGLAVAPDGKYLYVSFTDRAGNSVVDEFAMTGPATVEGSKRRRVLFVQQPAFANHKGGHITFGPDGYLYVALGDGGGGGDPNGNGENTKTMLGKLLRISPPAIGASPYGIPRDNPFAENVTAGRPEVFLWGVRNPWRFSFDRDTGDLWIGDVGQNSTEEIDRLARAAGGGKGANLGWNIMEGDKAFSGAPVPAGLTNPTFVYDHGRGCSVTGGYVYPGQAIAALRGAYVYGDFCESKVRGLVVDSTGKVSDERLLGPELAGGSLVSFGQDAAGELYVLSISDGNVSRLVSAAPPATPTTTPGSTTTTTGSTSTTATSTTTTSTTAPSSTSSTRSTTGLPPGTTTTISTAAAVRFLEPAPGARVPSPVTVKMVADNFVIEAAGLVEEGHGHFHLMIDVPCVPPGELVPRDEQQRHLGNGETEAVLVLPPGEHTICLQAGDGLHRALPLLDRRTFTVVNPPAAAALAAEDSGQVRKVSGSY